MVGVFLFISSFSFNGCKKEVGRRGFFGFCGSFLWWGVMVIRFAWILGVSGFWVCIE